MVDYYQDELEKGFNKKQNKPPQTDQVQEEIQPITPSANQEVGETFNDGLILIKSSVS